MAELHLFNPENDLALAHGGANFTAPAAARQLHLAAEALPLWYAASGDCVYAPHTSPEWWQLTCSRFGLNVRRGTDGTPAPWGWSANAVRQFRQIGSEGPFPDVEQLRRLSHRRTALRLHRLLTDSALPYPLPPAPMEVSSPDALPADLTPYFMKAPWSGSGRGVADCSLLPAAQARQTACGIIRRQGSVMLEPSLDKVRDFAALFVSHGDGTVTYSGLSLFFNSVACSYGGNLVAPQAQLEQALAAPHLHATIEATRMALQTLVGSHYRGPLGVDMMLHRAADGRMLIAPTVEVNLRRTMGHVALSLASLLATRMPHLLPATFTITPARRSPLPAHAISLLPPTSPFQFLITPGPRNC